MDDAVMDDTLLGGGSVMDEPLGTVLPPRGLDVAIPDGLVAIPDDILDEQPPEVNIPVRNEEGEVTHFRTLKPVTLREALFVREYIKDFDNKAVGKRMGLTGPQVQGLLARKHVRAEIQRKAEEQFKTAEMDAQWVLINIREVVERCMSEDKFDAPNALRGLELVGKRHAMFTDKVEVNQKTVIRIESNVSNDILKDIIDVTPKPVDNQ